MKTLVKTSLALVASLVLLLGCSKQASTPSSSSTKEDKTTQSSETKQSSQQSSEKKDETKNYIFVHNSNPGRTSTLTYTVKGDDVVAKQEVYNVFDPEILDKSAEEIKELIVKTYKKEEGLKGITQNIEFKDGKVIHSMEVDMTVVNLEEMKKAMPNEVSGSGSRVSFLKTRKMLKEAGYIEQTN